MYRTHNNGELRLQDVNSEVTLCGGLRNAVILELWSLSI